MSDLIVISDTCNYCGFELFDAGNFCSHCGTATELSALPLQPTDLMHQPRQLSTHAPQVVVVRETRPSVIDEALNNRAIVVAMILVAGPIGLPALWFSRAFSKRAKIITTVAYILLTAVLPLVALWYFLEVSLRPLLNIFNG